MVFSPHRSYAGARSIPLPCGVCMSCRINAASQWSTRCVHEAQCHDYSSFVTLTYSNECLPSNFSVSVRDLQLFFKRLRKFYSFRYFACGEYGETSLRPHYHALLFGVDFSEDRVHWRTSARGDPVFRSQSLERAWGLGNVEFGSITPASAAYVAQYTTKKFRGDAVSAETHYRRIHPATGEEVIVSPEFLIMSRKPGIGHDWFRRFRGDVFPSDFLVLEGRKRPVPRYYLGMLSDAERAQVLAERRSEAVGVAPVGERRRKVIDDAVELRTALHKRDGDDQ